MKERVLFIFNPHSGKGLMKNYLLEIVDYMVKKGYEITIYTTQYHGDATEKVCKMAKDYDRIICSGGDGTLNEVVSGLLASDVKVPIGYIPAGSTNDFAASLGITSDMLEAGKIACGKRIFPCDMGSFNGKTFIYVAAFGLFTAVSYETSQQMKNVLGHVAYILSGAKYLRDIPSYTMQVDYDNVHIHDNFIYGMITNSRTVGGFEGITGENVKLDDGMFEVTLIKTPKNPMELNEILACLSSLIDDSDLIYSFKTSSLHIHSKDAVAWTTDGEFGGNHTEVDIVNRKQCVQILVPEEEKLSSGINLLEEALVRTDEN